MPRRLGMNDRRSSRAILTALAALLLVGGYVGSYFALVEPGGIYLTMREGSSAAVFIHKYRYADQVAEKLFWPLEQIHRWWRPDHWSVS